MQPSQFGVACWFSISGFRTAGRSSSDILLIINMNELTHTVYKMSSLEETGAGTAQAARHQKAGAGRCMSSRERYELEGE